MQSAIGVGGTALGDEAIDRLRDLERAGGAFDELSVTDLTSTLDTSISPDAVAEILIVAIGTVSTATADSATAPHKK